MSAMEVSDRILLVTQLDLTCLRNVVRVMQFLDQQDGLDRKVEIVVNRMGLEDSDISLNKALETIGREVFWQLPNDYATMVGSRNNGIPLSRFAPKARLTRSIFDLTRRLNMSEEEQAEFQATEKKKGGLFSLFSK